MKKPSCKLSSTECFEKAGPLDSLFENMADGQVPNFLDVMAAISEISVEMTCDQPPCLDCKIG